MPYSESRIVTCEPWYGEWVALVVEHVESGLPFPDVRHRFLSEVPSVQIDAILSQEGLMPEDFFAYRQSARRLPWVIPRARIHLGSLATKRRIATKAEGSHNVTMSSAY